MAGFARGALGGATSGISQLLGSLMMGDRAQQQGYDAESSAQSKLAQSLAMVQQAQAAARAHDAQAVEAGAKTEVLQRRPGIADEVMASSAGVDVPTLTAYRQRLRTGQAPQVPMGPPAEDGGMGLGAAQFDPGTSSRISQALVRLAPVLNSEKDLNPEQYAKGASVYRGMDLGDQVLAGQRTAADVGRSQAAIEGKPLVAGHEFGVVDNFSGAVDSSNPVAQSFGVYRTSETGKNNAQARASDAAAGHSRASTEKVNAEITELNSGMGRGGKAPAGYRWAPGGSMLEVIPGGPADPNTKGAKLNKPPTEGQAKALMFGTRMAASDEVLAEMEKAKVLRPGATKAVAEGIARAVPFVGEGLADAAGAATNWTQSANQQSVEQAQRDFVNAVLRRESGAAISPVEFANATRQYFPQAGDAPQVLRQKASNRKTAISGFKAEFGEAMAPEFDRIVGEARVARQAPGKASAGPQAGGASGGWGGTAPNGQRVVPVTY